MVAVVKGVIVVGVCAADDQITGRNGESCDRQHGKSFFPDVMPVGRDISFTAVAPIAADEPVAADTGEPTPEPA